VTIGIEAPRDVKVVRGELQEPSHFEIEVDANCLPSESKPRSTLRDFAASVLPLQRQVG
jgi:sRNA-binding carbon storage regulator CsrA